jgi:hypothetical protein
VTSLFPKNEIDAFADFAVRGPRAHGLCYGCGKFAELIEVLNFWDFRPYRGQRLNDRISLMGCATHPETVKPLSRPRDAQRSRRLEFCPIIQSTSPMFARLIGGRGSGLVSATHQRNAAWALRYRRT